MVEILRAPTLGQSLLSSAETMDLSSRFAEVKMTPIYESQVLEMQPTRKEQPEVPKKNSYRQPRRAFSSNDYQLPSSSSTLVRQQHTASPATRAAETGSYFQLQKPASLTPIPSSPTEPNLSSHSSSSEVSLSAVTPAVPQSRPSLRPILPSPQRSYSVMDYEPIPARLLPGGKLQLPYLPGEIHFAIFDFLDPIDSTCLGLTSKHFYAIHRRMHGTIPLTARRSGPNDMEWAWRLAGPLIAAGTSKENAMAMVLPRGQVYCRKCGISRCELHKHIQEWFGDDMEYCEVRSKFGPKAPEGARKSCYRSSPRHPHRCGRHTRQQRVVRLV